MGCLKPPTRQTVSHLLTRIPFPPCRPLKWWWKAFRPFKLGEFGSWKEGKVCRCLGYMSGMKFSIYPVISGDYFIHHDIKILFLNNHFVLFQNVGMDVLFKVIFYGLGSHGIHHHEQPPCQGQDFWNFCQANPSWLSSFDGNKCLSFSFCGRTFFREVFLVSFFGVSKIFAHVMEKGGVSKLPETIAKINILYTWINNIFIV